MLTRFVRTLAQLSTVGLLGIACGDATLTVTEGESHNEAFLSVSRDDAGKLTQGLGANESDLLKGQVTGENFYVAIHKSQLGKKFFLSSYLKQAYPLYSNVGATSLGTRVVSFQVQNGQLVILDVDNRRKTSDTFNPELIVDAYPVIEDFAPFRRVRGWRDYVLFNPAEGKNEYSVFGDHSHAAFNVGGPEGQGTAMKIQASFLQRFRGLKDGAAFDKVFAGTTPGFSYNYAAQQYEIDATTVQNWGGTVTMSVREYNEGEGFTTMESSSLPDVYYFTGLPSTIPGSYGGALPVSKWNIKAGMAPIRWTISEQINKVASDPRFAGVDVVGAMKRGVENWNLVFGFKALEAVVGTTADSQGDDEKNFLVVDTDPSLSFAFADARVNPNTGEIRGASVYFNTFWFDYADSLFSDESPSQSGPGVANAAKLKKFMRPGASLSTRRLMALAKTASSSSARSRISALASQQLMERGPRMGTGSGPGNHLCEMSIAALAEQAHAADQSSLSREQKIERFITHVVLHEIGHTLGLRHNFKGSLVPPTSSVMDYVDDHDAVYANVPGAYDHEAIKYLYGLSTELPTQPFCNDSGVFPADASQTDPLCMPYDRGADPLDETGPRFAAFAKNFLENPDAQIWEINYALFDIYNLQNYLFGDAVSHTDRMKALEYLTAAISAADPKMIATVPDYYQRADTLVDYVYSTMFFGAPIYIPEGILFWKPSITDAQMTNVIVGQLKAVALDEKKLFDRATDVMSTRPRAISWGLKNYQVGAARQALVELDAQLAVKALVDPAEAGRVAELRAVIDNAINPYFW